VENFIRRGGNKNLGCTLITQRSAVLNKDVLTQADCLVILRTLAPQDKKAIQEWVKEQTDEDEAKLKAWYDSLKSLRNGEAYVWHPEPPVIDNVKVQFRERKTFHATREFIRSPSAAHVKLMDASAFIEKFKAVFKEQSTSVNSLVNASVDTAELKKLQGEVDALRIEVEEFRSGRKLADSVSKRLDFLGKVKLDLEQRLQDKDEELKLYAELQSVLRRIVEVQKIYDNIQRVEDKISTAVSAPIPTPIPTQDGAAAVVATETIPDIQHKIERPVVQTNEATRDGQLITMALRGFFDQERRVPEIAKELDRWYVFSQKNVYRDLAGPLEKLVSLKVLQRKEAGSGWVYSLADGAKDRIKEAS
jgi:hypothetical protein